MNLLSVKDVSHQISGRPILSDISFDIEEGDYTAILGPNGGGKTTLLSIMLGLIEPTAGKIFVSQQPLHKSNQRSHFGYVPQGAVHGSAQFPATVFEVVLSGTTQNSKYPLATTAEKTRATTALNRVGMGAQANQRIGSLSGGERQRVFLARALASNPLILFLDEPFSGVDSPAQESFYNLLSELHREKNLTIVLITHDIDAVAKEVEKVLCLNMRLLCHGTTHEILTKKTLNELYTQDIHPIVHHHKEH